MKGMGSMGGGMGMGGNAKPAAESSGKPPGDMMDKHSAADDGGQMKQMRGNCQKEMKGMIGYSTDKK